MGTWLKRVMELGAPEPGAGEDIEEIASLVALESGLDIGKGLVAEAFTDNVDAVLLVALGPRRLPELTVQEFLGQWVGRDQGAR